MCFLIVSKYTRLLRQIVTRLLHICKEDPIFFWFLFSENIKSGDTRYPGKLGFQPYFRNWNPNGRKSAKLKTRLWDVCSPLLIAHIPRTGLRQGSRIYPKSTEETSRNIGTKDKRTRRTSETMVAAYARAREANIDERKLQTRSQIYIYI